MVYKIRCGNCGKTIDFGSGEKPEDVENAIKFDGSTYCRECVRELVEFGTDGAMQKLDEVDDFMEKVREILDIPEED